MYVEIGRDVILNCTIQPLILLETVSISWYKITTTSETFLTSMRTLSIKNVQDSDEGMYKCTGESNGRTSEKTATIIIKGNRHYHIIVVT